MPLPSPGPLLDTRFWAVGRWGHQISFIPCESEEKAKDITSCLRRGLSRYLDRFVLGAAEGSGEWGQLVAAVLEAFASEYEHLIDPRRNVQNIETLLRIGLGATSASTRTCLDYGCGTGLSCAVAIRMGVDVVGVDGCPRMRQEARRRGLKVASPKLLSRWRRWQCGVVFASYVLHFPSSLDGLPIAWGRLAPGGVLVGNCYKSIGSSAVTTCLLKLGGKTMTITNKSLSKRHGPVLLFRKPL